MPTIAEVEKLAFDLPDSQRAVLAAHLLSSLPSVLHDDDEGIAEALRRDAEFDANPDVGISLKQLDQLVLSVVPAQNESLQGCPQWPMVR